MSLPERIRPSFLRDHKLLGLPALSAAETIPSLYRHMLQEPSGNTAYISGGDQHR